MRAKGIRLRSRRVRCGALAVVLVALFVALFVIPIARRFLSEHQATVCYRNMLYLRDATHAYRDEHDGRLPLAEDWCDALLPYVPDGRVFVCPASHNDTCSYAFNAAASGVRPADLANADKLVLLFESDAGWNRAGGAALLPAKPRHWGADRVMAASGAGYFPPRKYRMTDGRKVWLKEFGTPGSWSPVKPIAEGSRKVWLGQYGTPPDWTPRVRRGATRNGSSHREGP